MLDLIISFVDANSFVYLKSPMIQQLKGEKKSTIKPFITPTQIIKYVNNQL